MRLDETLALETIDDYVFVGRPHGGMGNRAFGGAVAGQAVMAAGLTVPPDRAIHSALTHFLLPGDSTAPVLYQVDPVRDGRSFTTRRVDAVQRGQVIFHLTASFHVDQPGLESQTPPPAITDPDTLPDLSDLLAERAKEQPKLARLREDTPAEFRFPDRTTYLQQPQGEPGPHRQQYWIRSRDKLPQGPLLHAAGLTYFSDMFMMATALATHGLRLDPRLMRVATLTHSIYFHAPVQVDEWFLYDQEALWTGGSRGLIRGSIYDRQGRLLASSLQEGLMRQRQDPS